MADVALQLNIQPMLGHLVMEGLKKVDGIILFVQLALKQDQLFCAHLPALLQSEDILSMDMSKKDVISNGLCDFVEAVLIPVHTTDMHMFLGCVAPVQVINSCVLVQGMEVTEPVDFVTSIALVIFVLQEPQGKCALGILLLHSFGSKGNGEESSEEPACVVGGISAVCRW